MPRQANIEPNPRKANPLPDLSLNLGSNGPDQNDLIFARGQLRKVDQDVELARKARKQVRSALLNRGIVLEDLDWVLDEEKKNDSTTLERLKNRARYAELLGLPIGTQLQFFDTPQKPGTSQESVLIKAARVGYEHGLEGIGPDEQAYPQMTPEGQEYHREWIRGRDEQLARWQKFAEETNHAAEAKATEKARKAAEKEARKNPPKPADEPPPDPDAENVE